MKVLVLGATGMAGHVVSLYLQESGINVTTVSAHNSLDQNTHLVDVTDIEKLQAFLDDNQYDIVINCIGLLVKQSNEKKDLAVYLNAYLPHFLERYYADSKTKIIHISSNGIFSSKNPPYTEDSAYDGESFYGRSKALGELLNAKDLTIRLSIIGPELNQEGTSLFNWFYHQTGEISGYTNVLWNGITTLELAKAIKAAIEQNLVGVYHLVPDETISKFELLRLLKEVFDRKDIHVNPVKGAHLDGTLVSTRKDFAYQVADYKTMIADMKTWIDGHSNLYKQYEK